MYTHSTKLLSALTGFLPVISSRSTTPNENTSDLSVSFPLDAYSGAKYLNDDNNKKEVSQKLVMSIFS